MSLQFSPSYTNSVPAHLDRRCDFWMGVPPSAEGRGESCSLRQDEWKHSVREALYHAGHWCFIKCSMHKSPLTLRVLRMLILRHLCRHLCKVCSAIHEMRRVGHTDRSEAQWITSSTGWLANFSRRCLHVAFGWRLIQKCHMAKLKLHPVPIPAAAILQFRRQWENLHKRCNGIMLGNLT